MAVKNDLLVHSYQCRGLSRTIANIVNAAEQNDGSRSSLIQNVANQAAGHGLAKKWEFRTIGQQLIAGNGGVRYRQSFTPTCCQPPRDYIRETAVRIRC